MWRIPSRSTPSQLVQPALQAEPSASLDLPGRLILLARFVTAFSNLLLGGLRFLSDTILRAAGSSRTITMLLQQLQHFVIPFHFASVLIRFLTRDWNCIPIRRVWKPRISPKWFPIVVSRRAYNVVHGITNCSCISCIAAVEKKSDDLQPLIRGGLRNKRIVYIQLALERFKPGEDGILQQGHPSSFRRQQTLVCQHLGSHVANQPCPRRNAHKGMLKLSRVFGHLQAEPVVRREPLRIGILRTDSPRADDGVSLSSLFARRVQVAEKAVGIVQNHNQPGIASGARGGCVEGVS